MHINPLIFNIMWEATSQPQNSISDEYFNLLKNMDGTVNASRFDIKKSYEMTVQTL